MRSRLSRARAASKRGSTFWRSASNSAGSRKKLLSLTVMASVTASASAWRPARSSSISEAASLKSKRRITGARRRAAKARLSRVSERPERRRSRRARNWKSSGAMDAPSDCDTDIGQLGANLAAVERLHHIFIGARGHGAGDLARIAFGGAEQDHRMRAILLAAHALDEVEALHARQVPIQENQVWHVFVAGAQAREAVLGFRDRIAQFLHDAARDRADHAAVIHDKAMFHRENPVRSRKHMGSRTGTLGPAG